MTSKRLVLAEPPGSPRIAEVSNKPPVDESPDNAPRQLTELKGNILIVDDRPDKLLAVEAVLASLGQNLVLARSGKEALRHLLKQDFAVIVLDVSMPGMDGFETAALIRKRINSEHTPIIFVTSIGTIENQIACGYALGAVDYILTPIVPDVLRSKISVFVHLHQQKELIKQQAEQLRLIAESRHQQELAEVADRLAAETRRNRFFTLAAEMLGITDLPGRLLQTNPSWERVLGYTDDELVARSIFDFAHPDDLAEVREKWCALDAHPEPLEFEFRLLHKDRSTRWLLWRVVPFVAESLVYIFGRDITSRKAAEKQVSQFDRELEKRVADLTEANRELEAFNYSIAHDLRTPLRSMSGFAQALLDDESANLTPMGLEYARRVARSAKYMDALLLDLLAYSRLGREEMSCVAIRLDEPVIELLAVLEGEIRKLGAHVEVASPLATVMAHPPTLKQILANLIGNGLKFAARDRPASIRLLTTHNRPFVRLWVEDNGIGIAPDHRERIFGLFQRLHDADKFPGTGIGLALVRKGVERMGGCVGVESELGKGSRFWVDLPAADQSQVIKVLFL